MSWKVEVVNLEEAWFRNRCPHCNVAQGKSTTPACWKCKQPLDRQPTR